MMMINVPHQSVFADVLSDFELEDILEECDLLPEEVLSIMYNLGVLDVPPWLQSRLEEETSMHTLINKSEEKE